MVKIQPKIEPYDEFYDRGVLLSEGGNGKVYKCTKKDTGEEYAIKILKNRPTGEKRGRFTNEISVMKQHGNAENGVLPIIDDDVINGWYIMPIATPIEKYFAESEAGIKDKIDAIRQLAKALEKLHAQGITHRDIKPDNLFRYEGYYCFGDFGLCEFPEGEYVSTGNDGRLGAFSTIAPEMYTNPKGQDGKKADVYSLAKTMWILLTGDKKGFPGPYLTEDSRYAFSHFVHLKDESLAVIEFLLQDATDNNPERRMTIGEFRKVLDMWIENAGNFRFLQHFEWNLMLSHIASVTKVDFSYVFDIEQIIHVLNKITTRKIANHVMLPGKGGLDLISAEKANEDGCIYLHLQWQTILLRPKELAIATFRDSDWSFVLLETEEQEPITDEHDEYDELIVEDYPAHYVSGKYAQYGVYDYDSGEKLPEGYKTMFRQLKGSFMIVPKTGNYNDITSTYDGRHTKMTPIELYRYVRALKNGKEPEVEYEQEQIAMEEYHWAPSDLKKQYVEKVKVAIKPKRRHDSRISYAFYVDAQKFHTFTEMWSHTKLYLTKDGVFKKHALRDEDVYRVYSREEAKELIKSIHQQFEAHYKENGYDYNETDCPVWIKLHREGDLEPRRFTLEKITKLMRDADDRTGNKLAIDEYGRPVLLQDVREADFYPVTQETWCAGNRYVGKYSDLSDAEDSYHNMLQGWLDYMTHGTFQFVEGSREEIATLESEIDTYYREHTKWYKRIWKRK